MGLKIENFTDDGLSEISSALATGILDGTSAAFLSAYHMLD
jgi:hypothetical protein